MADRRGGVGETQEGGGATLGGGRPGRGETGVRSGGDPGGCGGGGCPSKPGFSATAPRRPVGLHGYINCGVDRWKRGLNAAINEILTI